MLVETVLHDGILHAVRQYESYRNTSMTVARLCCGLVLKVYNRGQGLPVTCLGCITAQKSDGT